MTNRTLEIGDVMQITRSNQPDLIGAFLVVTEPRTWGAHGYLALAHDIGELVRFKGIAYLRVNHADMEYVGKAPMVLGKKENDK